MTLGWPPIVLEALPEPLDGPQIGPPGAVAGVGEPYGNLCDYLRKCRDQPRIVRLRHGRDCTLSAMNRHVAARAIAIVLFVMAAIVAFKVLVLNSK